MTDQQIEQRAQRAQDLFKQGFNCSQSVFAACADLYGIADQSLALRLSASFGGGIGRMRMACGAACGMFMLAGLHNGSAEPHDNAGKMENYKLVQELAEQYKARYGSIVCAELLGLAPKGSTHIDQLPATATHPQPEERTQQYYEKRPCGEMVGEAVRIALRTLRVKELES